MNGYDAKLIDHEGAPVPPDAEGIFGSVAEVRRPILAAG